MSDYPAPTLRLPVSEHDHIQGLSSAVVTLVEYGDYQCPFSGQLHPVIQDLQKRFGDQLRFVFRNFPLTGKHPLAQGAAEAAEAAGGQGKFWEMHDHLFEQQWRLDPADLARAAGMLGLDKARFAREVAEHVYADRIQQDVQSGADSGVTGTPTLFIDGVLHEDDDDFETLTTMIKEAIRQSKGKQR